MIDLHRYTTPAATGEEAIERLSILIREAERVAFTLPLKAEGGALFPQDNTLHDLLVSLAVAYQVVAGKPWSG